MKIFDFTDGKKGAELGSIKVASSLGGHVAVKNGKRFRVSLKDAPTGWSWHNDATNLIKGEIAEIKPEKFGVDAICFCIGEIFHTWHPGHPEAETVWEWAVIGTPDWNRNACKAGILVAEAI